MTSLQIQYFMKVAELQSFSLAAEALFITQPTISHQIAALERELGVQLFDRSYKAHITLTEEGASFYNFFDRVSAQFEELLDETRSKLGVMRGVVKIGVLEGIDLIPRISTVLKRWAEQYPEVQIVLERRPMEQLNLALEKKEYDMILQVKLLTDSLTHVVSRIVSEGNGVVLYSAHHPLAAEKVLQISDLKNDPLYTLSAANTEVTRQANLDFFRRYGFEPICVPMPNGDSILHAISAGRGFGVFHPWSWYGQLTEYRTIAIDQTIPLSLAILAENKRPGAIQLFDEMAGELTFRGDGPNATQMCTLA